MKKRYLTFLVIIIVIITVGCSSGIDDRLTQLERENAELRSQIEALSQANATEEANAEESVAEETTEEKPTTENPISVAPAVDIATPSGNDSPSSEFLYAINEEGVTIRSYKGSEAYVIIPELIEDVPVTVISEKAFSDNETIKSITFPKTIIRIGEESFKGCKSLEEVIFPVEKMGNLTIEEQAFYNTSIQNSIVICASSVTFGWQAFCLNYDIPEIAILAVDVSFTDDPFGYCKSVKTLFFLKDASVTYKRRFLNSKEGNVFTEMENLEMIVLPGNITFTSEYTYAGDPKVVVYSEKDSQTLLDANAQGIPTNSDDYNSVYNAFITRYKDAGFEIS